MSGLTVMPPPVFSVIEFTEVEAARAAGVLVRRTLVPLVKALATISVPTTSGRRMLEAAPSVVPKLVPEPVALASTTM
jgi:hypothetical protein